MTRHRLSTPTRTSRAAAVPMGLMSLLVLRPVVLETNHAYVATMLGAIGLVGLATAGLLLVRDGRPGCRLAATTICAVVVLGTLLHVAVGLPGAEPGAFELRELLLLTCGLLTPAVLALGTRGRVRGSVVPR